MADLIHLNYLLIPVINRFGISLGFGDSNIEAVCKEKKINVDFFLEIVNAYHDNEYFPHQQLQSFSITLITEYLIKTHQFYLEIKIPEIENLVLEMVNKCYPKESNIGLLNKFFSDYKLEFINHIEREEEVVFPYTIEIEKAFINKKITHELKNKMLDYSINDYKKQHDDVVKKLYDLKNIIIKYLHSPKDINLCSKLLNELFYLENDLNNHERIEDKVMIPKVIKMEKYLRKLMKN